MKTLEYDTNKWREIFSQPVNTLQVFITNKCNMRCKACFYAHNIGREEISLQEYKKILLKYMYNIDKVILLGGEPTLYRNINKVIALNTKLAIKTTVYTNGSNLKILEKADLSKTKIRIGVYGAYKSEKPLQKVPKTNLPVTIVYMLRKDNVKELMKTAKMAEKKFNCQGFYISSIRDITVTNDYWKDTEETLPLDEYSGVIQRFINNYRGNIRKIHIAKRGIIKTKNKPFLTPKCRFGNIFPDKKKIICPLDISKKIYTDKLIFNQRKCNKNDKCILQKIVLERITS